MYLLKGFPTKRECFHFSSLLYVNYFSIAVSPIVYLLLGKKSQKWLLNMYKNSRHYLKTLDGESHNSILQTKPEAWLFFFVVVVFNIF